MSLSVCYLCHWRPVGIPIPYIHGYAVLEDPIVSVHHYARYCLYVHAAGPYRGTHAHT